MKELTELERHIYECAKEAMPSIKERIEKLSRDGRTISFFYCDGLIDSITYNPELKKFVEIEYRKCVGKVTHVEGLEGFSGFSYETEICSIDISELEQP
jgi:hypothetical protein